MTDTREATQRPDDLGAYPPEIWVAKPASLCAVGFTTPSQSYNVRYVRADLVMDVVTALRDNLDRFVAAFPASQEYPPIKRGYEALSKLEASHGSA